MCNGLFVKKKKINKEFQGLKSKHNHGGFSPNVVLHFPNLLCGIYGDKSGGRKVRISKADI